MKSRSLLKKRIILLREDKKMRILISILFLLVLVGGCYSASPNYGGYNEGTYRYVPVHQAPAPVVIPEYKPPVVETPALDHIRENLFEDLYKGY